MNYTAIYLALCLSLGACSVSEVEQIQARAKQYCGYVDNVGAVAKIVAVANATTNPSGMVVVTGVDATAHAICDAIANYKKVQTAVPTCPKVNGVCVQ